MLKKIITCILCISVCILSLCSCGVQPEETTASPVTQEGPTGSLTIGSGKFSGNFSPFFAKSTYDAQIAGVTGVSLLNIERGGSAVTGGISGEKIEYKGTKYAYGGIADCSVTQNKDGMGVVTDTVYDFTLSENVTFSDGVALTADDVIFTMYVLCDPSYSGYSEFNTVPIAGLEEYKGGTDSLSSLLISAGRDNRSYEYWTEQQQSDFWAALDRAGESFAESIVSYVLENYSGNTSSTYAGGFGKNVIGDKGLETAFAMAIWGYGEWDRDSDGYTGSFTDMSGTQYDCEETFPTAADFWNVLTEMHTDEKTKAVDYKMLDSADAADKSLFELLSEIAPEFNEAVAYGESVSSISGIVRTGDYSFSVTTTGYDALTVCQMCFTVAPLHYYGDVNEYDYDNDKFGFTKGDLSGIREKNGVPLGAGAYKFKNYENGTVTLDANTGYFLGSPSIETLKFRESADVSSMLSDISDGVTDICELSEEYSDNELVKNFIDGQNSETENIGKIAVDNNSYGYIGICAKNVLVGDDAGSEESKNLRKAFATVFASLREEFIGDWFGEFAGIIEYPISSASWAAPRFGECGYETAYSRDVDGNTIYSENMTSQQRLETVTQAARGFLEAAGYEFDENSTAVSAPKGARLEYAITIPAGGTGDHPTYGIAVKAALILRQLGITLEIKDPADDEEMWKGIYNGSLDMWAAAWDSAIDPDMYSLYYSSNYPTNDDGSRSNIYYIADSKLDGFVLSARVSYDRADRRQLYTDSMKIVLDWGVEVPVYQSRHYVLIRSDRVATASVARNITPFYGWLCEVYGIQLSQPE